MANIDDICDFIITKLIAAGEYPTILKVQKLLYYVQAWNLAIHNQPLFNGKFEAWVHGPVNRQIFKRFANFKQMYSVLNESDCEGGQDRLEPFQSVAVDNVLNVYAAFSGGQLEDMTHGELPWLEARGDLLPSQRCENEISEETMKDYYAQRLH